MPCKPVIDGDPQIVDNDLLFKGHCDGACPNDADDCAPEFSLTGKAGFNKGAKITGSGSGPKTAFIRVTAEDDIDKGQVLLTCSCGGKQSGDTAHYDFTLEHRTTVSDVLRVIVTAGISALVKKITG